MGRGLPRRPRIKNAARSRPLCNMATMKDDGSWGWAHDGWTTWSSWRAPTEAWWHSDAGWGASSQDSWFLQEVAEGDVGSNVGHDNCKFEVAWPGPSRSNKCDAGVTDSSARWAPSLHSARRAPSLPSQASGSAATSLCTSSKDAQPSLYPQLAAAESHHVSSEDVSNDSVLHLDCFEVCEANQKCIVKPKDGAWDLAFDTLFSPHDKRVHCGHSLLIHMRSLSIFYFIRSRR